MKHSILFDSLQFKMIIIMINNNNDIIMIEYMGEQNRHMQSQLFAINSVSKNTVYYIIHMFKMMRILKANMI